MGPGALDEILKDLPNIPSPDLLVGYESSDDACVYRVTDGLAVIQTVDFFTPIVDDPYLFGQIAAANALSDVYAMGGEPKLAMNLLCVPGCLPPEAVREILRGGHEKAAEAGCTVAGGHTVRDDEPKYGLCVTGFVSPERILKNIGAKPGDLLILTKPLGTGIVMTAAKAGLASAEDISAAVESMRTLNASAAKAAQAETGAVHACTDITGFGLLGHCCEMAAGSGVTVRIRAEQLPLIGDVRTLASYGLIPEGAYRNSEYVSPRLYRAADVPQALADIAADPQTSGGLLLSVSGDRAEALLESIRQSMPDARIIGEVLPKQETELELV